MATEWHYSRNGKQHGPVSVNELRELAADGQLQRDDLVWREGMTDWMPAEKVKGLFDEVSAKKPPKLPSTPPPEISVRIVEPKPSKMASVAKWATIGWSGFCLFGVIFGLGNAGANVNPAYSDAEKAGTAIGLGCGMGIWFVIWAAIAVPSLVIWLLSRRT